jgi:hypothetical protein
MTIQSLPGAKSADVFIIRATETVKSAAELMRQHGVSALVEVGDDAIKVSCTPPRRVARQQVLERSRTSRAIPSSRLPPATA